MNSIERHNRKKIIVGFSLEMRVGLGFFGATFFKKITQRKFNAKTS